jgi:hypothetical protein
MREREYYLHTIDSRPAFFDVHQICFSMRGGYTRTAQRLADSLAQIRAEQKASNAWRVVMGYSTHSFKYGYVRVRLPDPPEEP